MMKLYISNAVVTCYRFNEYTSKWDLWNDDIISPRAVTTTDSEGNFHLR